MTEKQAHQKRAQALRQTAVEMNEMIETGRLLIQQSEALLKRSRQLLKLAEEFEDGQYLAGSINAAVADDTGPSPAGTPD